MELMGDIYARAAQVVACIGPSDVASETLLKAAQELRQFWSEVNPMNYNESAEAHFWERFAYTEDSKQELKAMRELFCDRPYFQRVWIVQELHEGAGRTVALCGLESLPWTVLMDFGNWNSKTFGFLGRGPAKSSGLIDKLYNVEDMWRNLPSILQMSAHLLCMDPRDRVYGVARLLLKTNRHPPIVPDYTLSRAQLVITLIRVGRFPHVAELHVIMRAFELSAADTTHELHTDVAANVDERDWIVGGGELLPIHLCHDVDAKNQNLAGGSQEGAVGAPAAIYASPASHTDLVRFHATRPPENWSYSAVPLYGSNHGDMLRGDVLVHGEHFDMIVRVLEYSARFLVVGDATVVDNAWEVDCCGESEQEDDTAELSRTIAIRLRTTTAIAFTLYQALYTNSSGEEFVEGQRSSRLTISVAAKGSIISDDNHYQRLEKQKRSLARELKYSSALKLEREISTGVPRNKNYGHIACFAPILPRLPEHLDHRLAQIWGKL